MGRSRRPSSTATAAGDGAAILASYDAALPDQLGARVFSMAELTAA
jgi:hypothetical protein